MSEAPGPEGEVLFTAEAIQRRVRELAGEINAAMPRGAPHVVTVLKGALFFGADLIRAMAREMTLGFVSAQSYGAGTVSSGEVRLNLDALGQIAGREVLIAEDILDTGRTLSVLTEALKEKGAAAVRTCVLLDKPARREVPFTADHTGFTVPDHFLIGYGLDAAERWRWLREIRVLGG